MEIRTGKDTFSMNGETNAEILKYMTLRLSSFKLKEEEMKLRTENSF